MSHTLGLHPHLLSTAPSFLLPVSGTVDIVTDFMSRHTGGKDCAAVNLGCDGYKISCAYGANSETDDGPAVHMFDRQLHYVHAPRLHSHAVDGDDMGGDGWMDWQHKVRFLRSGCLPHLRRHAPVTPPRLRPAPFTPLSSPHAQSYGNMEKFTSFMHNKFVLFTSDITSKARELAGDGHDTLMRLSSHKDGYMVAHVSVPMVGYTLWEFVGVAPPECDDPSHSECMYTPWSAEECPAAHAFDTNLTASRHRSQTASCTS